MCYICIIYIYIYILSVEYSNNDFALCYIYKPSDDVPRQLERSCRFVTRLVAVTQRAVRGAVKSSPFEL